MAGELPDDVPAPLVAHLRQRPEDVPPFVVLLAAVAQASGTIDEDEQDELRDAIAGIFGASLTKPVVWQLVGEGLRTLAERGVESALTEAGEVLAAAGMLGHALEVALDLAGASDGIEEAEQAVIVTAARAGGMSDEELVAILEG